MTQEHTPGPWIAKPGPTRWNVTTSATPRTYNVAAINTERTEQEANARLIAAAPDLLKMLQTVVDAHDYKGALTQGDALLSPAIRDQIMHAINQAKGA